MVSRGNLRQAFNRYPFSFRATLYRAAVPPARISFQVEIAESEKAAESLLYQIEYAQTGTSEDYPSFTIFNERLSRKPSGAPLFDRGDPPAQLSGFLEDDRALFSAIRQAQIAGKKPDFDPLVLHCAQHVSRFNRFRLEPSTLASPSRLPDATQNPSAPVPRIGYAGEDLAATLYRMNEISAPELASIKDRIREIEPSFQDFEFNTLGADRVGFSVIFSDGRQSISAPRLSSGMLTYIGLIVLVTSTSRPAIMMIEEPENGLTPQAVQSFYKALKTLAENPDATKRSQVLISSHSPFVICEAWNGEDRGFIHQVKITNGKSQVRKFSEAIGAQGAQLGKDADGQRTHLSLKLAEEVMSGRYA